MNDPVLYAVAQTLLECAQDGLNTTEYGAPSHSYVVIGTPAHDNCCEGQLTASIMRQYSSLIFPDEFNRPMDCGGSMSAIRIDIELIRCAPTEDSLGRPPTGDEMSASALQVAVEAQAVWHAVSCCLQRMTDVWVSVMTEQVMITPEGGCVGSRLTVIVGLTTTCGCD